MRIAAVEVRALATPLTRPYTIAFETTEAVEMVLVRVVAEDGSVGLGTGTPAEAVTGESFAACRAALADHDWLVGGELESWPRLLAELARRWPAAPAARAAVDIALHDLWARRLGRPLVDLLGRCHDALPTSVTIGIQDVAHTLAEAEEHVGRGFRVLKIKLGHSLEEDLERLRRLRERFPQVALRTDANQGYSLAQLGRYLPAVEPLGVEFTEQPVPPASLPALAHLPAEQRARLAADESLHDERDALRLAAAPVPCGIFNVKLMKCGGIRPALGIARIAEAARLELMWGCMDESVVGIAAALHAAFASPATRHLDLDGSLDLARDPARGGFVLQAGVLRTVEAPGLGVELA